MTKSDGSLWAGVMSGTSVDGIDVAIVRFGARENADAAGDGGSGIETLAFGTFPFEPELKAVILRSLNASTADLVTLTRLHVRLAYAYADAIRETVQGAALSVGDLTGVGCHGQTVQHLPDPYEFAGRTVRATLQLGDASVLAQLLGVTVVGDFRMADLAHDGQGAPLVPYVDYRMLHHRVETRGALNIGGIANLTVLPAGKGLDAVYAFDTGPGNMISDALCRRFFDVAYDRDAHFARAGHVDEALLHTLLKNPYFDIPPPRSTGHERFGAAFVEVLLSQRPNIRGEDAVATAAAFTAHAVHGACNRFVPDPLDRLIVSGGGAHNLFMMDQLKALFDPITVDSSAIFGLDPDAREAVAFAVLAHETLAGVPTSLPRVTGARRAAVLGKICMPG